MTVINLRTAVSYFLGTHKPNSKLDQYFLIDEVILNKEVNYASLNKDETVLEIGAGLGFLTGELAKRASKVYAVEKDVRMIPFLEEDMPANVEIMNADVLKLEFPGFTKFVSNIPYSISSPLALKLLRSDFKTGVIICQREFAHKLVAEPGTKHYGRISVLAQYYSDAELLDRVLSTSFLPEPPVQSSIVRFTKKRPFNPDFEQFITNLFRHRRKKVGSLYPHTKSERRPGKLAVADFIELFELFPHK